MRRIALFLLTNIAVLFLLSIVCHLFGVDQWAAAKGYGKNAAPQLAEALPSYVKHAVGLENFPQWATVEQAAASVRAG